MNNRERSETERHWDQLALGYITIATALIGAVILISGLGAARPDPLTFAAVVKTTLATLLVAVYGGLFAQAGLTIFTTKVEDPQERIRNKEANATSTFSILGGLIAGLGLIILVTAIIPPNIPWTETTSKTITVDDQTWTKLECLAGQNRTDEDRISTILQYANGQATPDHTTGELTRILYPFPWFICVQNQDGELQVHVTEESQEVEDTVPSTWQGLTVKVSYPPN